VHQTGVFAGAGAGALCAGLVADRLGWRMPFVIVGSLGVALCTILVRWLRDPPTARTRRRSLDAAGHGPFRTILHCPAALYVCAIFFLASGASAGLIVWAPTFLHDELGLDLAGSALYGAVTINLAGFLFVPIGAFLAERLASRTTLALFYTLALGLALAGVLLLPLPVARSAMAVGWVLLASSAGKALFDGCIYAAMHEVVPAEARATAVGLMTMVGFCGAGLTPVFVAQASASFGMSTAMSSMAVLYVLAVALLLAARETLRHAVIETRRSEELHTRIAHERTGASFPTE
jgi:nitrate/nitrite transporter NarK